VISDIDVFGVSFLDTIPREVYRCPVITSEVLENNSDTFNSAMNVSIQVASLAQAAYSASMVEVVMLFYFVDFQCITLCPIVTTIPEYESVVDIACPVCIAKDLNFRCHSGCVL